MADAKVTVRGKAPGEADFFYTLDRVLGGLLAALKAGRIDDAVDVYMRCREDIGFQLIARAQADEALFKQTANLFFRARDFARAAYCCEQLEQHEAAAQLYERCDDYAPAAQNYAAAGLLPRAAEMFEKAGNLTEAARLYRDLGEHARAASAFARAQHPFDAATSYQAAGLLEKAIEALGHVDEDSPDRKVANRLVKDLLAQTQLERARTGQIAASGVAPPAPPSVAAVPQPVVPQPVVPEPILVGGGAVPEDGHGIVTVMEGFDGLRQLPLFAELSLAELKDLYHLCRIAHVDAGTTLIARGQQAPGLFVVMTGSLVVENARAEAVATVGPGGHVGEMSLLDDAPANARVRVEQAARILRLDADGFRRALAANDGLSLRIYRVFLRALSERLRAATARITPEQSTHGVEDAGRP